MAATYATAHNTVIGDQRAYIGVVHMNDGEGLIDFGMDHVNACVAVAASATSGGMPNVTINHTSGNVNIASVASGDSFNFIVLGS